MKDSLHPTKETYPDTHHGVYSKTLFGFWVYLLTDFVLFATYFAVYVVLQKNTFDGPPAQEIFHPSHAFIQTLLLLFAGFTSGCGGVFAHRSHKQGALFSFALTFVIGLIFLMIQFWDYRDLIAGGNTWKRSAFLTSYFNLVSLHTLHLIIALLWTIVLIIPVFRHGITEVSLTRLCCLKMFWQFLALVWIFIFTIVYLAGVSL